ncbi:MAG TPA: phosphate signaling complex protein PhoU [Syntrophales bacterium]|nr:phosphate signaling complex protein PhoU [Syntrophales bacterium]HPX11376.1 phosphate signaling complex protein PhoU [Syntrophales bacterium]HQB31379.1 phosphate signaling complex protein PhoU [Syntrophales bacterium]HQN77552.1 phosphate signaling complex protein PhoU [Syntrophales bacterium]HQQ26508.1 phosphate signaling complex protein PhoU [Syntrophales bacterium]
MKVHTSSQYERNLSEVKENLVYLGALVEKAIHNAMKSLLDRDSDLARTTVEGDRLIDCMDEEIEEKCITLLALRQPIARDLRFITTAIKINGHLERIGDMAVTIAERAIALNEEPQLKPYIDLPRMAEITEDMIRNSLDALIHDDVELANRVRREDDIIDKLNEQIFRELLTFIMEDPKTTHRALLIMQISKNLERISDHAKSIADMVVFMVTGQNVRHQYPGKPKDSELP